MAQKCNNLLRTNKYVLFFHYNGAGGFNWEGKNYQCKTLFLPSKILQAGAKKENGGEKFSSLIQGGALLVACSSLGQMATILERCSSPAFFCIGGAYEKRPYSHLDIKRWVSLYNSGSQAYVALLAQLMHIHKMFLSLSINFLNLPLLYSNFLKEKLLP